MPDWKQIIDAGGTLAIALLLLKIVVNDTRHANEKLDKIIHLLRRGFKLEDE